MDDARMMASASSASAAAASEDPSEDMPGRGGSLGSGFRAAAAEAATSSGGRGSAFGLLMKRNSQLDEGTSQFSSMFRDLKSDDVGRQITALTELSEYLSFSSEEALISFPMETFIPILIRLLESPGHADEMAAQVMLLCCRCLHNVVDILPPTARIITAAGGLPVLCTNLLNVEYIDVAELTVSIVEWISEDQPLQVLKAGGLQAILTFLDFFQISVQRQAANAAALMLQPVPSGDLLEQHVRPVLPTLASLLQHSDPQVLQSVCECWRRVLDNTIAASQRPKSGSRPESPPSSAPPSAAPSARGGGGGGGPKWRPVDRSRREGRDEAAGDASASGGAAAAPAPTPLPVLLEEMCPSGVLSNLLVLLGNGSAPPTPHSSVVLAEVLYILAVLTNYSESFTEDVLKQDISVLLRQMVLSLDLAHAGPQMAQANSSVLRVLALVASMLPAIRLTERGCECEEQRAALFRNNPAYLDTLAEAFAPLLLNIYEASMDPSVQALCVSLLLAFMRTSRDRPEIVERSFEPAQLACFLANLLLSGVSRSQTLACLVITSELLERHPAPYSLLFVRHGVVRAIHQVATREDPGQQGKAGEGTLAKAQGARSRRTSKAKLSSDTAHRVLSVYFASSSHTGESPQLRSLGKIARQLRSSPTAVIAAHREALTSLRELLLSPEGVTTFELMCSGAASALNDFLFPPKADSAGIGSPTSVSSAAVPEEWRRVCGDRLRLFVECVATGTGGSFAKLVKLSVSALQRLEQLPLKLFPTHATAASSLPPHLRTAPPQSRRDRGFDVLGRNGGGFGADGHPGGGGGRGGGGRGGGHDSGPGTSTLLSVLRLLAKPVRVRMGPHGAMGRSQSAAAAGGGPAALDDGAAMPNLRSLLSPFGGSTGQAMSAQASKRSGTSASSSAAAAAALPSEGSSAGGASVAASPAARLRNYLASKVTRKRAAPYTGLGGPGSAAPTDKRSGGGGGGGFLGGRGGGEGRQSRRSPFDDRWSGVPPWDDEDFAHDGPFGGRGRDREGLGEALEAVLLVEPFASVAALEDYIWDRHGPRAAPATPSSLRSALGEAYAAVAGAADSGPGARARGGAKATTPRSAAAAAAGAEAPGPRVRLSSKQPPAVLRTGSSELPPPTSDRPATPLAIVDPNTPSGGSAPSSAKQKQAAPVAAAPAAGASPRTEAAAPGDAAAAASPDAPPARKRYVRIYLNGKLLPSKTSVVESLVSSANRQPPASALPMRGRASAAAAAAAEAAEDRAAPAERFLICAEDDASGPEGDALAVDSLGPGGAGAGAGPHSSPRHFCGAIWGRVHTMTYELVPDGEEDESKDKEDGGAEERQVGEASVAWAPLPAFAVTDFDALVQRHVSIPGNLEPLRSGRPERSPTAGRGGGSPASAPAEEGTEGQEGAEEGANFAAGLAPDQEAFVTMLQLISAFHSICDYLRETEAEFPPPDGDAFHCGALTGSLLRQLSDPLAVCTGSVPSWCSRLAGTCRFLFPHNVRRILHHSCNLGLSRALHHVQQRALAQHAPSQEAQRRLEAEVAVASIPRQKVRISRQRILESAVKVMNLYGSGSAILEVEYVGEVGTGSGPTLEFFTQVADILRSSEPKLFRDSVPAGMLFPAPRDPAWLAKAEDQDAQLILERFRLLGQVVAKCILDGRLVDIQLHPLFWRAALKSAPISLRSLWEIDPELYASMTRLRQTEKQDLEGLCVDFTLPGSPGIELKPGGQNIALTADNLEEYISSVVEVSLVSTVAPQLQAFCTAFKELLPLEACTIWSERELSSIIVGASVRDDACWTAEHLSAHIKAQHGYNPESRCFRDLLEMMAGFAPEDRRRFLTFATGAPSLPIGGFGGLKPPLTVVKKEAPPAPMTPDQFMPSVMTCANYLKLPEYSTAEVLRRKLEFAMSEGQSAFLLS